MDESTVWARSIPSKGWFKSDSSWPLYCKDYGKFNMLGRISTTVKSQLKVFEGNMNSIKLIEIMEEILPKQYYPIKGRRQMQILLDNSRIHTSKKVKEWAAEKKLKLLFLPKYSPDLNFIELVWAQLKHKIQSEECKSL